MKNSRQKNSGMTLAEVSLAMMVMVIFLSVFSLISKYFESYIKLNLGLDRNKKSLIENENIILRSMDKWSNVISQPSYSKEEVLSLKCSYPPKDESSLWNLPGKSDPQLPKEYKYCVIATSLGESKINDLINGDKNAKPGIYLLYAIPDTITPTIKPIRRILCRPITFC